MRFIYGANFKLRHYLRIAALELGRLSCQSVGACLVGGDDRHSWISCTFSRRRFRAHKPGFYSERPRTKHDKRDYVCADVIDLERERQRYAAYVRYYHITQER
jgi:hypothetical protein